MIEQKVNNKQHASHHSLKNMLELVSLKFWVFCCGLVDVDGTDGIIGRYSGCFSRLEGMLSKCEEAV